MATAYTPYTGTYDTEYQSALKRAQTENNALSSSLTGLRKTDESSLAQQRDYTVGQLGSTLAAAQKSNYGDYMSQQRSMPKQMRALGITGGAAQKSRGQLGQAYNQARAAGQASHDKSFADTMQQWQVGMNDIASRYGQMDYNNMQNMYNNANSNAWNAYNAGLTRDSDMWNRSNTETYQNQQQTNADRDYDFAREQWLRNLDFQQQQLALQRQQL